MRYVARFLGHDGRGEQPQTVIDGPAPPEVRFPQIRPVDLADPSGGEPFFEVVYRLEPTEYQAENGVLIYRRVYQP